MEREEFEVIVNDIKEQMVREIEQGVLKHDLYQANAALGGKDACERILRSLAIREPRRPPLRAVQRREA